MSYRARLDSWVKDMARIGTVVPLALYVMVTIKTIFYLAFFHYLIRDRDQSAFSELNAKRFILYNILGDVLGLNSTNGVLGSRYRVPFVAWWNFLHTGTLTVPLLPGLPFTRGLHLVLAYIAYLFFLIHAMLQPQIGFSAVLPALLCLAFILPQDLVIFLASRGEHYGYFLVCCAFSSENFLFGCQMIQAAIWTWAGIAKVGPWFKYVNATMPINSLVLRPFPTLLKRLHRGPEDSTPSTLCQAITIFATALEISLGVTCIFWPTLGVPLITKFHLYIFSMVPFASVMEWNIFCIFSGYYLFWFNTVSWPVALHPVLAAFLVLVSIIVPTVGQLFPKLVPFLIAYRPYAGNWRWTWHIVSKKGQDKLRRLKSWDSVYLTENAPTVVKNKELASQMEHSFTAAVMNFPHFRPLVPLVEELEQMNGWRHADDYVTLFQEPLFNAIYGWCLGTGFYVKASHFEALRTICKFEKGECYVAIFEPMGLLDHTSEWKVIDVADWAKPVIAGSMPYHELEQFSFAGVPLSAVNKQKQ